ncbi:hypothetical protein LCGC14_1570950 [marine sediment metagenome]|uniref:Uncharacterized protein n=1 Tax=marine sediment metagenome TaxID=412755 RepID=A0A0F9LK37_9ZZZZ
MLSTPERCECGGPAICERCGRMLPDHHTMSLLDHIDKLEKAEKLARGLAEEVEQMHKEIEELDRGWPGAIVKIPSRDRARALLLP